MTSWVGVLPYVHVPYVQECRRTMVHEFSQRVRSIDNTRHNRGVAASWNAGVDLMFEAERDWLVVISAAVRFGRSGGMDFISQLEMEGPDDPKADHYPDIIPRDIVVEADGGLGWHLIAFHRSVFETVGRFDENFFPAYYEDNDMSMRIQHGFGRRTQRPIWTKVPVDATHTMDAHALKLGGVNVNLAANRDYFVEKWGGDVGKETFDTPFDVPCCSLAAWPRPLR